MKYVYIHTHSVSLGLDQIRDQNPIKSGLDFSKKTLLNEGLL